MIKKKEELRSDMIEDGGHEDRQNEGKEAKDLSIQRDRERRERVEMIDVKEEHRFGVERWKEDCFCKQNEGDEDQMLRRE